MVLGHCIFVILRKCVKDLMDPQDVTRDTLTRDLGMGSSVQVRHMPKHSRQTCDIVYGVPNLLTTFVPPVISRSFNPLPLRILSSGLVVANTSPASLQS
jgi:hypothetical protein